MEYLENENSLKQEYVDKILSSGRYTWVNYEIDEPSLDDGNQVAFYACS